MVRDVGLLDVGCDAEVGDGARDIQQAAHSFGGIVS